jgi:hypothetical protein
MFLSELLQFEYPAAISEIVHGRDYFGREGDILGRGAVILDVRECW